MPGTNPQIPLLAWPLPVLSHLPVDDLGPTASNPGRGLRNPRLHEPAVWAAEAAVRYGSLNEFGSPKREMWGRRHRDVDNQVSLNGTGSNASRLGCLPGTGIVWVGREVKLYHHKSILLYLPRSIYTLRGRALNWIGRELIS